MKNPFRKLKETLNLEDQELPFLDHLEAFRQMLFRCLIAVAICTLVCIPLARPLLDWLQAPLLDTAEARDATFELITTSPVEGFLQVVKVIFAGGVLISLPLLIFFIAQFVLPGLEIRQQIVIDRLGVAYGAGVVNGWCRGIVRISKKVRVGKT